MHIRPYQPSDLTAITNVMIAANKTDSLSLYFRRDTDRYPLTDHRSAVRFLKNLVLGVGTYCLVTETDPWDYPTPSDSPSTPVPASALVPEVIGWSMYTRHGSSPTALRWLQQNSSYSDSFNRWLMHLERDHYHRIFTSVDHTHDHAKFKTVLPLLSEPWDPKIFAEAWELAGLFVHPGWQRRGLGRKMMQWGMDRATEEKIPLIVGGSALGGPAYRKAGFKSTGVSGFGDFFDECRYGGEAMQRWVWEPEGVDVLERATGSAKKWREEQKAKKQAKQ